MTYPKMNGVDHVCWNFEAGQVIGRIVNAHRQDIEYKGHKRRPSPDEPQYTIESDKTGHMATHKGSALGRNK